MKKNFSNKTVLITAGSQGIGRAVCELMLKNFDKVVVISRKSTNLKNLKDSLDESLKKKLFCIKFDLEKNLNPLFAKIKKNNLIPDILINNLGGNLNLRNPLLKISDWRRAMNFNLEVAIMFNNFCIPYMKKKNWGRICHVSSIAALENQGTPSYCAAKAALNAYVRSVGRFFAKNNVIMTSVMPGAVMTDSGYWSFVKKNNKSHYKNFIKNRMAIDRLGSVDEISELILFLCSEKASFCVGSCFLVDGGQGRVFQSTDI